MQELLSMLRRSYGTYMFGVPFLDPAQIMQMAAQIAYIPELISTIAMLQQLGRGAAIGGSVISRASRFPAKFGVRNRAIAEAEAQKIRKRIEALRNKINSEHGMRTVVRYFTGL